MRTVITSVLIGVGLWLGTQPAEAVRIDVDPLVSFVTPGSTVKAAIRISEVGNLTAPSLGAFDLDVNFDPAILALANAAFGDPVLGDQLDLFGLGSITAAMPGAGTINLFELSLDAPADLEALQRSPFMLATLTFDTLSLGTSPLDVRVNALADAFGDSLDARIASGTVNVIPEASTWTFFAIGVIVLVGSAIRRRRSSAP